MVQSVKFIHFCVECFLKCMIVASRSFLPDRHCAANSCLHGEIPLSLAQTNMQNRTWRQEERSTSWFPQSYMESEEQDEEDKENSHLTSTIQFKQSIPH